MKVQLLVTHDVGHFDFFLLHIKRGTDSTTPMALLHVDDLTELIGSGIHKAKRLKPGEALRLAVDVEVLP